MLDRVTFGTVDDTIDWFLKKVSKETYDKRRQLLSESSNEIHPIPAIDYILQSCIKPDINYPPQCMQEWHQYFTKLGSGYSHVFQQTLLVYLKLDIRNYLAFRERESTTGRQTRSKDKAELQALAEALNRLERIPVAFDFTNSVIKLSTGLWALDNEQPGLMISCLSDPAVSLSNYFNAESSKELMRLIIGSLYLDGNPRMALFMSKIHRHDNWDEVYDPLYAFLLINSGQLIEALKYERTFMDQDNYSEILQSFFELCSKCDVTKSLNCLNLSVEEEEFLNQHLIIESRPVTPSHAHPLNQSIKTPIVSSSATKNAHRTPMTSTTKPKHYQTPRNRSMVQRMPSFNDSPAKNTRSARKKKTVK